MRGSQLRQIEVAIVGLLCFGGSDLCCGTSCTATCVDVTCLQMTEVVNQMLETTHLKIPNGEVCKKTILHSADYGTVLAGDPDLQDWDVVVSSAGSCTATPPALFHAGSCSTPVFPARTESVNCRTLCEYDM